MERVFLGFLSRRRDELAAMPAEKELKAALVASRRTARALNRRAAEAKRRGEELSAFEVAALANAEKACADLVRKILRRRYLTELAGRTYAVVFEPKALSRV